jgi:hypothetical protein
MERFAHGLSELVSRVGLAKHFDFPLAIVHRGRRIGVSGRQQDFEVGLP